MLYGFLNIYKEKGMTSFDVIQELRKKLNIKKIGHTGTLDPLAKGVLVVAIGEATKLIEFLMNEEKSYSAKVVLGKKSDTYDAEGELEKINDYKPEFEKIKNVLKLFEGWIEQIPPKYSAIKIKGKKAYEMARNGEEFEMKKRKVEIKNIALINYDYPIIEFDVECSSGTYIRSLANDIGEKLGTGAYLKELLRTKAGNFIVKDSIKLKDISQKDLIPLEAVSIEYESVEITHNELEKLNLGQFIKRPDIKSQIACAFYKNKLVGIIEEVKNNLFKYKKKLNI
jgi:tRNA pseudouridine55 synthase